MNGETQRAAPVGTYLLDTRAGRIGEVMAQLGGYLQLRPVGGGREWDCHPADAEPPEPEVLLRERVRSRNRQSRVRERLEP